MHKQLAVHGQLARRHGRQAQPDVWVSAQRLQGGPARPGGCHMGVGEHGELHTVGPQGARSAVALVVGRGAAQPLPARTEPEVNPLQPGAQNGCGSRSCRCCRSQQRVQRSALSAPASGN